MNLMGGAFAFGTNEPLHAATHAVIAIVSGLWALRLGRRAYQTPEPAHVEEAAEGDNRMESLEAEMDSLRRQFSETQERLDFAERMLARPEPRRADRPR